MLLGASVCPHPPLLVPAVAGAVADEAAALRAHCLASVRRLADLGPALVVVVGAGPDAGEWPESAGGDLRAFGVAASFGGPDAVLPPSLTIAASLLDQAGWSGRRRYVSVPHSAGPAEAAALGAQLVTQPTADDGADVPVAVLAMGDGSAKRSDTAPGYLDPRAARFDADVVASLSTGPAGGPDVEALLGIEPGLADELWVAGRPAWQVLAGAARAAYDDGASIKAAVRYDEAPWGVGYFVVDWLVEAGRP